MSYKMNTLKIQMCIKPKVDLLKNHSYASCYHRRLTKKRL